MRLAREYQAQRMYVGLPPKTDQADNSNGSDQVVGLISFYRSFMLYA